MKKIKLFLILSLFLLFNTPVFADVMPYYTGALSKSTIGFLQVPQSFTLYSFPRTDSQIVENISWTNTEISLNNRTIEPSTFFAVQIQNKNLAYCMVIDFNEDWYKIIYDKENAKSGWIKIEKEDDFWSLKDFYNFYGKKYGLYYMKNIDYNKRGMYSGADKSAQKLNGFTYIRAIKMNKLSGNWILATVLDIDNLPKIGYIQWREDDGTIIIFPKINH